MARMRISGRSQPDEAGMIPLASPFAMCSGRKEPVSSGSPGHPTGPGSSRGRRTGQSLSGMRNWLN